MKKLTLTAMLCLSPFASGNDLAPLIEDLQGRELSLETIAALVDLNKPSLKVGYGLCEASGQPLCKRNGSLGYGLCEVADGTLCKVDGSLGYGLCVLAGAKNCREDGSLGYGMCVLAGEKNCKP